MQIPPFPDGARSGDGEHITTALFCLLFPFIISLPLLLLLAFMLPDGKVALFFTLLVAYIIPPAGKESIIPFGIILGYPWWMICSAILIIDSASALLITLNFHHLYKIPIIGDLFIRCSEGMQSIFIRHRWISRFSLAGLFIFIFFPLQGSGAINGTILSRLMSIDPRSAFVIIITASGLSCLAIAFGVTLIDELTNHNLSVTLPIFILIIGISIITFIYGAYRSHLH